MRHSSYHNIRNSERQRALGWEEENERERESRVDLLVSLLCIVVGQTRTTTTKKCLDFSESISRLTRKYFKLIT